MGAWRNIKYLKFIPIACIMPVRFFKKGENMKKVLLALFAVMTLAACTGSYHSGNCEYDFLLHKDISISKIIGSC